MAIDQCRETRSMGSPEPADQQEQLWSLYAAFNRRDVAAVLAALAPDVSWPTGWEGGSVRGHDQVRAYWRRQWAAIDPVVVPTAFHTEDDGRVTVTAHQVVRTRQGAVIADQVVTHVYRFAGGLIVDMAIQD
ncbi:nuclear transport factor 2 family protein [Micromonospora sp. NPDC047738]|uniref:nuclear transport factor 2 family protein n=1 Tax=Micromonospora sp. NPDC047738 TaxID=3155741 RepID=UPI0033CDF409